MSLIQQSNFGFASVNPEEVINNASDKKSLVGNQKKITAKTLCDITGTRYYVHNEEIGFDGNKLVRVYDENDTLVGDMLF